MSVNPTQNIYPHGGSRIYLETDGGRQLICDSYLDEKFAKYLLKTITGYLNASASVGEFPAGKPKEVGGE